MAKISKLLKTTVDINKHYTSAFVGLSKNYVKAMDHTLSSAIQRSGPEHPDDVDDGMDSDKAPVSASENQAALLLAGESGETAQAAFPIKNHLAETIDIELGLVTNNLPCSVQIKPRQVKVRSGKTVIVRLYAAVDESLDVNQIYRGRVALSHSTGHFLDFMLVRLDKQSQSSPDMAVNRSEFA